MKIILIQEKEKEYVRQQDNLKKMKSADNEF